jgi:LCP family protein required for cell wall assembly
MNLRKFYFALTSILLIFMFSIGVVMLNYLKTYSAKETISKANDNPDGFLSDAFKHFAMSKEPINAVLLVGDKSEANTDTMMVANYDPSTNQLNIMSIPRDTKVILGNGKAVKINSIYVNKGGDSLLMKTLSNMLDIDIEYYVYLNLATFREIIDFLDGVWIDIPCDLDYDDPHQDLHIHLKKGRQLLNGKKSEEYLRFRHPNDGGYTKELLQHYDGSDLKRIEAQQRFIKEFVKQKAKISNLPKLNNIIDTVFENLETNFPLSEVLKLVKLEAIKDFSVDKVNIHTLPGYSMDSSPWYYIYDKEKTEELIKENFSVMK